MIATTPPMLVRANLSRVALRLDAAATAISGLALVAAADPIASLLGVEATFTVAAVGFGFFWPSAAWMVWASTRPVVSAPYLLVPMLFNVVWVLASAVMVATGTPDLPTGGRWLVGLAAGLVAVLADVEWIAWRRNSP